MLNHIQKEVHNMKDVHDYYSFICHRSEDKAFALKLQKRIERYKIPSKLGFPTKYVRHVFVDKNAMLTT